MPKLVLFSRSVFRCLWKLKKFFQFLDSRSNRLYRKITMTSVRLEVFCNKRCLFLKISQYWQKNTCMGVSFLIKPFLEICNFFKTPTQLFPCKFLRNFWEHFIYRAPPLPPLATSSSNSIVNMRFSTNTKYGKRKIDVKKIRELRQESKRWRE